MNQDAQLSVVILAAGKGTRMKSARAKVLHEVFFRPMLHHVLNAVELLQPLRTVVIVGHQSEDVKKTLIKYNVEVVEQRKQLGTGHAVQMAEAVIPEENGLVMILCGDSPLINSSSLQTMYERHVSEQVDLTVMTTVLKDSTGYGRIISDGDDILAIVEEKEANDEEKRIKEINAGIYLVRRNLLFEGLENITQDNTQGEFYLTDIVEYSVSHGLVAHKFINHCSEEVLGVNSRVDLEAAHREFQRKRNEELMQQGITMHDSSTVSVSPCSEVGNDTLLMQNVQVSGNSTIGKSCTIENGAVMEDCTIGDNVHIGAYSVLKKCQIDSDVVIQPLTSMAGPDSADFEP